MVNSIGTFTKLFATSCSWLSLCLASTYGEDALVKSDTSRQYYVDAKVFSVMPDVGLDSYRSHSGGGVGPRGRLSLGVSSDHRHFDVSIKGSKKDGRFLAHLTVVPRKKDRGTAALEKVLDLSDLKPLTLDLARDDDNRIYVLNLFPRIIEQPLPKTFRASDLALEHWHFQGSHVILNDQDYLGQLNMGSSPIAWIDVPGLAKVEFSLLPLTEANPEGVLENGTVRISHKNECRIRVTNVRNGTPSEVLQGGPYRVWVRWLDPSQTVEQYRQAQKVQLASLKEQVKKGDLDLPQGTIDRLERLATSDRILQISGGLRGARKGEIERSDE